MFEDTMISVPISFMNNNGEDSAERVITKTVREFRAEIERVKNLQRYRGEDDLLIKRIERIILDEEKRRRPLINVPFWKP